MSTHRPVIVPVGGFLGAGKTTLLVAAVRILARRGLRAAVLMNDQGGELVDTNWAMAQELTGEEVTGGCFCCRFTDFLDAAERLHEMDVIFAEPVGSCTDISATILQPLKSDYMGRFRLAPFTVLVDPLSVERLRATPETAFLFENQLAEADIVCFTKMDLCEEPPELPGAMPRHLSARTGEGVEAWLNEVLSGDLPVGTRVLEIDYARYAAAEAALGWLNCTFLSKPRPPLSPASLVGPLLDELDRELTRAGARIAHLKVLDRAATGFLKAGITANGQEPDVDGDLAASPSSRHEVIINLRAMADPEVLRVTVEQALPSRSTVKHLEAFRPAAPKPERRVPHVVR